MCTRRGCNAILPPSSSLYPPSPRPHEQRNALLKFNERVWLIFETPESSRGAYLIYVFLILTILLSITNFVVSSMQSVGKE